MFKFRGKVKENKLDTEIDEFGDLKSLDIETDNVKVSFRRDLNIKALERLKYDKTGISQLGTTYPISYDREELIKFSKKPINWYCYNFALIIITLFIIVVDFICYLVMLSNQLTASGQDFDPQLYLVAIGIAVAIDLLPIFLAHNLHRQEVDRKKVLKIFGIACLVLIGVFVLTIFLYRILNNDISGNPQNTADIMQNSNNSSLFSVYLNIIIQSLLYLLIPFATSFLCFILNYLNYNPLTKKIFQKRREVLFKQEDISEIKAVIKEIESQNDYSDFLCQKDEIMYESANQMIDSIGDYYRSYVRLQLMKGLRSPADTTDLSV